jgi:FkbM family methyltransferase
MLAALLVKIKIKINWYRRVCLSKVGIKIQYKIGNTYIRLEQTHRLPDYQETYPYYDRFLPHLVAYLPANSVVVDVGANVGDTLAGMIGSNADIEYICVEADSEFYAELLSNVDNMREQFPDTKIHTVNKFAGDSIDNVSLAGSGGTKNAVLGGTIRSESLEKIIKNIETKNELSLIKTDVDGFDYDVIRSAYGALSSIPPLYFECMYENNDQLSGYIQLFAELKDRGYENFSLFDNFGQYICCSTSVSQLEQLLDYVAKQNFSDGTRTYNYYDILAYSKADEEQIDSIISDYVKK